MQNTRLPVLGWNNRCMYLPEFPRVRAVRGDMLFIGDKNPVRSIYSTHSDKVSFLLLSKWQSPRPHMLAVAPRFKRLGHSPAVKPCLIIGKCVL
jgi:hypothetical protein